MPGGASCPQCTADLEPCQAPARRRLPARGAACPVLAVKGVPDQVAAAGCGGGGRLDGGSAHLVGVRLGGHRAEPHPLGGAEVGLAADIPTGLPELRPADPPGQLRLSLVRHVQSQAVLYSRLRGCRRVFEDGSVKDVPRWMVTHLDAEVLPDYDVVWDRTKQWKSPGDQVSG